MTCKASLALEDRKESTALAITRTHTLLVGGRKNDQQKKVGIETLQPSQETKESRGDITDRRHKRTLKDG